MERKSYENMADYEHMKTEIEKALDEVLPAKAYRRVYIAGSFGGPVVRAIIAASDYEISRVAGQHPQRCTLSYSKNYGLEANGWGGFAGALIYRKPDKTNPRERMNVMTGVRVPFRRPKNEEKAILRAVKRFGERWAQTLRENLEVLRYQDIVDYKELLES